MIKCLIVDDEPLSRQVLKGFVSDHPDLELAGECKDALEAMSFLQKHGVDLLFLDINMPKLSGVNFYKSLQNKPEVIFTTAYSEFAVEGFELNAIDYLMKPIAFERFIKAIQKVKDKLGQNSSSSPVQDYIMLKADKKMYRTPFEDILFCEALGDYVKVHLSDKVLIVTTTMKKLLTELPEQIFLRTHKSYIINKTKVEYIEGNQIKIGEGMVSIGQSYRDEVMRALG
ncbi:MULTISPECIES: LytR/AlgR family response regulator transcription factor [Roseivirga]|uniref:Two-component system response regulator n=1 Tax=Roseivirga spongicola TaxID=333140 RepID=A0A150XAV5_9BACT|nr:MULTISPECIES: LytTR family DNA-binding domain-containing protein [Roseivirga]KYG75810.1 two-component system response regulator [Roseivirga spongicola]MBO6662767.1 response regulator transcription factor [Roseivirga sp.]MBO6763234.1 response regulator transcription factor [Roseivirga sp.]MBO6909855.1 response regulator transcription factor [Roseivirga sp.]WPZ10621.1 LytTR family DNA-binding domain-containing protein [Roseivirga spongicola]